jgi:Na+/H+-dicarboxylate symporter
MLTVIRSYSSLEITLFQAAWTALFSFLVSFALPAAPDGGLTAALIIIGGLYGRGLDDGWLILAPVLPILAMLTVLLDTATAALLLLLANRNTGLEAGELTPALRF